MEEKSPGESRNSKNSTVITAQIETNESPARLTRYRWLPRMVMRNTEYLLKLLLSFFLVFRIESFLWHKQFAIFVPTVASVFQKVMGFLETAIV